MDTKTKRVGTEVFGVENNLPKRRRTTIGGEGERPPSRLSIDRADAPSLTARTRLPSPVPRHSYGGPVFARRESVSSSPIPAAPLMHRVAGSPRASPRQSQLHHPRFVDLLRRDPSQQRALDSARSILDTLDRVTTGPPIGGGSAKKYRPPQPLRPMRFKSLTSASRPVSLYDMLSGAAQAAPSAPGLVEKPVTPALQPVIKPTLTLPLLVSDSPRSAVAPSPKRMIASIAQSTGSPRNNFLVPLKPASPRHGAGSPTPLLRLKPASPRHAVPGSQKKLIPIKPASPKNGPVKPASPKHVVFAAPKPETTPAPPTGGFVWGDPSKVSDADFIDEDGFAPGAEDSDSSSGSEAESPKNNVSSIFGTGSILGTDSKKTDVSRIFGKPSESGSISVAKPAGTTETNVTFGGPSAATGSVEPISSIFGTLSKSPTDPSSAIYGKQSSIFGTAPSKPTDASPRSSILAAPVKPIESASPKSSLFGAPVNPTETSPKASLFGTVKPVETSAKSLIFGAKHAEPSSSAFGAAQATWEPKNLILGGAGAAQPSSVFGESKPIEETKPASIFGSTASAPSSIFGQAAGATAQPSSVAASSGMFVFGATPPASPAQAAKPASMFEQPAQSSLFGPSAPAQPTSSIFGGGAPTSQSIFGSTTTTPAEPQTSIFGSSAVAHPTTPSSGLFGTAPAPAPLGSSIFGGQQQSSSSAFSFGAASGTPTGAANPYGSSGTPTGSAFGGANIFGAPAGTGASTPTASDNPFAASGDEFNKSSAPKRKILKAARRT